jgi:hypothetical protein
MQDPATRKKERFGQNAGRGWHARGCRRTDPPPRLRACTKLAGVETAATSKTGSKLVPKSPAARIERPRILALSLKAQPAAQGRCRSTSFFPYPSRGPFYLLNLHEMATAVDANNLGDWPIQREEFISKKQVLALFGVRRQEG